ncbi:MAG: radical SAM protein, partial [Proteobacteria bacterium]|nr:radical SAM protein [Pseudomonadota bacterium]
LDQGRIDRNLLARAGRGLKYVGPSESAVLKRLETPHVYHLGRDDLYEVNEEAFEFLLKCDGQRRVVDLRPDPAWLDFCLDEDLLRLSDGPHPTAVRAGGQAPTPSLRYLELQITRRCNLACRHCYLGSARDVDMAPKTAALVLDDLAKISGLRVMVSGGEPLSHPRFEEINDLIGQYPLRRVLLTNGTLLTRDTARRLRFHEVQVSLDGLEAGHDALRGPGGFGRALAGLEAAREAGLDVSVATMVHAANLEEFQGLARLIDELGVIEWGIDAPCAAGRFQDELRVSPEQAARVMTYGFGGGFHGGDGQGYTCGRHLATVTPEGRVAPCGFYEPLGRVEEGLATAWSRRRWLALGDLDCADCPHLIECGGGCRFRAQTPTGQDPVMCAVYKRED